MEVLGVTFDLSSLILTMVSTVAGSLLLGGAVSWFFFKRSQRRKRLSYFEAGEILIGARQMSTSDLKVLFKGRFVHSLHKLYILFWNSGNVDIDAADVPSSDPLRIRFREDITLLSVTLLKTVRIENTISITKSETGKEALIRFDFLGTGDGALIEVLYEGTPQHAYIGGTIKNHSGKFDVRGTGTMGYSSQTFYGLLTVMLGLPITISAATLSNVGEIKISGVIVVLVTWCAATIGILRLFKKRRSYPSELFVPGVLNRYLN